jgi:thymidine kinase
MIHDDDDEVNNNTTTQDIINHLPEHHTKDELDFENCSTSTIDEVERIRELEEEEEILVEELQQMDNNDSTAAIVVEQLKHEIENVIQQENDLIDHIHEKKEKNIPKFVGLDRIRFLSDGVIAIVVTLIVLELNGKFSTLLYIFIMKVYSA